LGPGCPVSGHRGRDPPCRRWPRGRRQGVPLPLAGGHDAACRDREGQPVERLAGARVVTERDYEPEAHLPAAFDLRRAQRDDAKPWSTPEARVLHGLIAKAAPARVSVTRWESLGGKCDSAGLSPAEVRAALDRLEAAGIVHHCRDGYWVPDARVLTEAISGSMD